MALTVLKIGEIVRRRLDAPSSVGLVELCNLAGRHLTAMYVWEWLERAPVTLTLNSGSSEVKLPDDFGRMDKIETNGSLLNSAVLTTPAHLLELENSVISLSGVGYWMAVVWKKSVVDDAMRPVLRVYPSISSTGTLSLYYYAGWAELTSDDDVIPVPAFMEALYVETVCSFAQGYDEHDLGSVSDRLGLLMISPLYATARALDTSVQDELGELRNGVGSDTAIYQSATIVGGPYRP